MEYGVICQPALHDLWSQSVTEATMSSCHAPGAWYTAPHKCTNLAEARTAFVSRDRLSEPFPRLSGKFAILRGACCHFRPAKIHMGDLQTSG